MNSRYLTIAEFYLSSRKFKDPTSGLLVKVIRSDLVRLAERLFSSLHAFIFTDAFPMTHCSGISSPSEDSSTFVVYFLMSILLAEELPHFNFNESALKDFTDPFNQKLLPTFSARPFDRECFRIADSALYIEKWLS